MKKKLNKLSLNRETLRTMTDDRLAGVQGGNHMTVSRTHDASNCSDPCCTNDSCFNTVCDC